MLLLAEEDESGFFDRSITWPCSLPFDLIKGFYHIEFLELFAFLLFLSSLNI